MADARSTEALALAEELERRDGEHAAAIEHVAELARRVEAVRTRAAGIGELLAAVPGELARLDGAELEAREAEERAAAELASAESRLAELEGRRRPDETELAGARSAATRARESVADARARIGRLDAERRSLLAGEAEARAGSDRLVEEAHGLALELRGLPRLSEAGKGEPAPGVAGVLDWGGRAHAALLLVRSGLDVERERTVREANELGSVVLGEPLGASSVAVVRRRLQRELDG